MPLKTGVDESGCGMRQDPQASKRAFAFQASRDAGIEFDILPSGSQREFPRMQDPRLVRLDLELLGQLALVLGGIDIGVGVIVEQTEEPVEPDVD